MRHCIGKPLDYQRRFLNSEKLRRLFVSGVGTGKTTTLVYLAFRESVMQPGIAGALFAPDFKLFKRVVLPKWKEVVPRSAYTWRVSDQEIRMNNGTVIYCMGCDKAEDRVIGMNLGWAAMDEAGAAHNERLPGLILQRLRVGDPKRRFIAMASSPHGYGWMKDWSKKKDKKNDPAVDVIRATTYDNPYLSQEYIEEMEVEFPVGSILHRQEMLGEFVALTGLVYGDLFDRALHVQSVRYDPSRPYSLGWDPGSRASGVVAIQTIQGGRHAVFREWTPDGEFTEDTARGILRDMGKAPRNVYLDTPSKLNTRSNIDDAKALRAIFGKGCTVSTIGGKRRSSSHRHRVVSYGLNKGLFVFSSSLTTNRVNDRGIVRALEALEWPDKSTRLERQDEKNRLKHIVDALEFYSVKNIELRYHDSAARASRLREAA